MKTIQALWIGFKNSFGNIKNDYPINDLWDITNKIEKKIQKIDYETNTKTKRRIKQFY